MKKELTAEENKFREYIKKDFGGLQELSGFLGIKYQSVINTLNGQNNSAWLKLLKRQYKAKKEADYYLKIIGQFVYQDEDNDIHNFLHRIGKEDLIYHIEHLLSNDT